MKLLAEIDDYSLGLINEPDNAKSTYFERRAARAIIFNQAGEIALLHAKNRGYHKLPGGGIEGGEDWKHAIAREAMEEIGYHIILRPQEIGEIIEWRAQPLAWCANRQLKQISYCGVADVTGEANAISLEMDEIEVGLTLKWAMISQAIEIMLNDHPDDYEGKFIKTRDLTFLKEFRS